MIYFCTGMKGNGWEVIYFAAAAVACPGSAAPTPCPWFGEVFGRSLWHHEQCTIPWNQAVTFHLVSPETPFTLAREHSTQSRSVALAGRPWEQFPLRWL